MVTIWRRPRGAVGKHSFSPLADQAFVAGQSYHYVSIHRTSYSDIDSGGSTNQYDYKGRSSPSLCDCVYAIISASRTLPNTLGRQLLNSSFAIMEIKARDQWNWRHFFICFAVAMSMLGFSYPASIIGTTLAQPSFYVYMKLLNSEGLVTSKTNSLIGAMSGVFQAGGVFGIFSTTYVMERWGRKAGMIFCAVTGLLGGIFVCAAQNVGMFIAFKFLAGFSSWSYVAISMYFSLSTLANVKR